ncbi:MAG: MlaD family protein [Spirochaetaceae bacterium]|jgi:phospholipid/cholesterol/gamma-HCH transport system substrate-binding protein|nr:MlaD family protein [Spirochaetaceae bacterium]
MRFRIRFADQIVGILTIIALLVLGTVVFLLGGQKRWFARDFRYLAYFDSAAGLGSNMPVQYKGFTIGNVKAVRLTEDDRVEAVISIFDIYVDRVREGSLVELAVSPIGLGNQFLFYPGRGEGPLAEGTVIPNYRSPEGRALISRGLAAAPSQDDGVATLVSRANAVLENLNNLVVQVEDAFTGTDETVLGRTLGGAEQAAAAAGKTLGAVEDAAAGVPGMAENILDSLDGVLADLRPVIGNLERVSGMLAAPDGAVALTLDGEGDVYANLEASVKSLAGILGSLERAGEFIPAQLPQIAALILELQKALRTAQDVLTALTNNPLLKGGVPPHGQLKTDGASFRDIRF